MKDIQFVNNGIHIKIHVDENEKVTLQNCSLFADASILEHSYGPLVEVQGTGFNHYGHHGQKHTLTSPGYELKYEKHHMDRNEQGDVFFLSQTTNELRVTVRWQFFDGIQVLRAETIIENIGKRAFPLEYVSSFALTGLGYGLNAREGDYHISIPHNTWYGECQWKTYNLHQLGYDAVNDFSSAKRISLSNIGTWACSEYLPMGSFQQPSHAITWQIETSASWCWEISDLNRMLYLNISGPCWSDHQFKKI